MKTIWKILEAIIVLILTVVLLINGMFLYTKYIKKDVVGNVFGYTYMVVQSESMLPDLKYKDIIIVKMNEIYKVGDIITYKAKDIFVTHRVVQINASTIITKGDSNNTNDAPIEKNDVVGVVVKVI